MFPFVASDKIIAHRHETNVSIKNKDVICIVMCFIDSSIHSSILKGGIIS